MSRSFDNTQLSSNESISHRSATREAGSEILEETGEANGAQVPSQDPQEHTNSKSKSRNHHKAKKSFLERLVERSTWRKWRAPRRRRRIYFANRGHRTAMLLMPVDLIRVWCENITGKLPNKRAASEGSSGQPS